MDFYRSVCSVLPKRFWMKPAKKFFSGSNGIKTDDESEQLTTSQTFLSRIFDFIFKRYVL